MQPEILPTINEDDKRNFEIIASSFPSQIFAEVLDEFQASTSTYFSDDEVNKLLYFCFRFVLKVPLASKQETKSRFLSFAELLEFLPSPAVEDKVTPPPIVEQTITRNLEAVASQSQEELPPVVAPHESESDEEESSDEEEEEEEDAPMQVLREVLASMSFEAVPDLDSETPEQLLFRRVAVLEKINLVMARFVKKAVYLYLSHFCVLDYEFNQHFTFITFWS